MPNWMTHRMRVFGDAEHLRAFVKKYIKIRNRDKQGEDQYLDFDLIIPMPTELREVESGSLGKIGYEAWYGEEWRDILAYPWVQSEKVKTRKQLQKLLQKMDPEYKKQADKRKSNIKKYGSPDWYEWSIKNWGTKWNSSDLDFRLNVGPRDWGVTEVDFTFLTAWSPPEPILQKLSEMEPDLKFDIVGLEGGAGFSCKGSFQGGIGGYDCTEEMSPERYEEVFGMKPPPQGY